MTEDIPVPPPPAGSPPPYPAAGQPSKAPRSAWFWVAIIGGCFVLLSPVLLIILALTVPQMLKVEIVANQASAIETMRSLSSAELSYFASYATYPCSIAALGGDPGSGAPTTQTAQLIDPALASTGQKAGYTFTVTCGGKMTTAGHDTYAAYKITGVPVTVGKTGDRGFCSNQNGDFLFDPAGGTNCIQPIQ